MPGRECRACHGAMSPLQSRCPQCGAVNASHDTLAEQLRQAITQRWPSALGVRPGLGTTVAILFGVLVLAAMLVPTSSPQTHGARPTVPPPSELRRDAAPEVLIRAEERSPVESPSPPPTHSVAEISQQTTFSSPPSAPAAQETPPTLVYWYKLMAIMESESSAFSAQDRQAMREACYRVSNQVSSLSVVGVDEEPVEWALQASRVLRDMADADAYLQGPQFLIYTMTQGANGRPFDGVQQAQAVKDQITQRLKDLHYRQIEVRNLLSRRYGIDLSAQP